jgi:hypothetical protein
MIKHLRHALKIEHAITSDMPDGQPLPPFIEDGLIWRVVRRADGRTLWRRLLLNSSPVTGWRTASGHQSRAPSRTPHHGRF